MDNPFDDGGNELDAKFSIELFPDGFDLVIESQGGSTGGRPPRNVDYSKALRSHIARMKGMAMVLIDVQIASHPAMKHPESDRQIELHGYPLPLALVGVDSENLRLAIGRASAAYGRGGKSGGNPTKKLRLRMQYPDVAKLSPVEIATLLISPIGSEVPTADAEDLAKRVILARKRQQFNRKAGWKVPPKGRTTVPKVAGSSERFVRDPEVIAWVLEEADGRCEKCGGPAPFCRDDGDPFLEVHHVRPLAKGGPDTIDNAAACCPNCHRQLHHDPVRTKLRQNLIAKVGRLKDYPRLL